ncbi:adenylate/guanylate cyclase domain-containing protein [Bradyrhizobium sp. ISRA443]|uniref:adenylate/guanylate cyclase domain-containing protein n=1 Tax=unclassified Bradyrhizobium TaxID=2631580 RepID=UPI00247B1BAB|nr:MULTISPECIES: adenylate/guanylate cyclase domain-containing protein [unclassified Bradyrhizobium]WGS01199.1 adenylate/guanylate cyclase domain-containing protein [Bradyrhizobium sp. ISRA436]WGS08086.1 adenylate/guanylate cyclase domain-containing protein [Bradyrhizobium sp. ISRA437]WGS14974.1 adenylate/guanylate cyclase domain-containing protein [Bradyrhizobium sp. ISRA443]
MNASELRDIIAWMISGARSAPTPSQMMAECCERVVRAGLPLWRVGVFVRTLHPEIAGRNFIWKPGAEVEVGTVDYQILESPEFVASPLAIVFRQGVEVRARVGDPASARFPIVEDLRAEGVTDYIALPLVYMDGFVNASSWTTKQPGGFTEKQLNVIRSLTVPLARYIEIVTLRRTATLLLDTYVGNRAGERIMGGQIRRGHADTMDAAIWLSDLRGFTALSDRLPAETVVEILNLYFDCQVSAIRAHGGEVLKFMGDGLLAVFPVDEYVGDEAQVCSRVLEAVRESRAGVAALQFPNGEDVERFRFGVALHLGRVLYGNIGGGNRLDFTCIGPAVNLAARLERIAGRLGRTVVASARFAGICDGGWSDLGEFPIAGFSKAERVYGLHDEAPRTAHA